MASPESIGLASEQRVTASALVRQFGIWQERAARAPVYVMHRGRPRLVLASVELMDALCRPSGGGEDRRLAGLLDAAREPIVLVDRTARITASSLAARALFGPLDPGAPVAMLARGDGGIFLASALARVAETGRGDVCDLVPARRPDRLLACALEPVGDGAALFARDVTDDDRADRLAAAQAAQAAARSASGRAATATIGLRGYLDAPDAALAAFTGIATETLAATRFVTLIEIGTRIAVSDAIEGVLADGHARGLDALLLAGGSAPVPVRLGLAPLLHRGVRTGVSALLVRGPGGGHA